VTAPGDQAGGLQAGLHPRITQADAMGLLQAFMEVAHVNIAVVLSVEP
jgi:hypothetical protein